MVFSQTAFQELAQTTGLGYKKRRLFGEYRGRAVHVCRVSYGCLSWLPAIVLGLFTGEAPFWDNKIEILVTLKKTMIGSFHLRRALSLRWRAASKREILFERQFRVTRKPKEFLDPLFNKDLQERLQCLDGGIIHLPGIRLRLNRRQLIYTRQEFFPSDEKYADHLLGVMDLLCDIADSIERA